jgi:alpha-beta hydrolase superfamily lysophospholipase
MTKREEGYFKGHDHIDLYFQSWRYEKSRGTLVVTHGLGEHSECYNPLAEGLLPGDWDIVAWDLRGHGRSEGRRGLVESFEDYCLDLVKFINVLKKEQKLGDRPFVFFGHSMGGLITLRTLVEKGLMGAQAVALSAPLLGIAVEVPALKLKAANLIFKVFPSLTMGNELKYEDLSRDSKVIYGYDHDPLRNDKISLALYFGILESMDLINASAEKINFPLLMQLAGQDRVVSTPAAESFFDRVTSTEKKKIIYHEAFHEIFNDLDRTIAFQDLKEFLSGFLT